MRKYIIERRPYAQMAPETLGWAYVVVENPDDTPRRFDRASFIDCSDQPTAETRANSYLDRLLEGTTIVRTVEVPL